MSPTWSWRVSTRLSTIRTRARGRPRVSGQRGWLPTLLVSLQRRGYSCGSSCNPDPSRCARCRRCTSRGTGGCLLRLVLRALAAAPAGLAAAYGARVGAVVHQVSCAGVGTVALRSLYESGPPQQSSVERWLTRCVAPARLPRGVARWAYQREGLTAVLRACVCGWVAGAKSKAKAGAGAPTPGGGPATKEGAGGAGAGAAPGSTGGGNALRHLVGVERLVDRLGLSRDESNASTGTTNTSNTDFTGSTSGSVLGSSSRGRSSSAATAASSVIDADARSGPSPARSATSPALAALVRKRSAGELPPVHPGKLARTQSEFTRHEEARLLNAQGGGGASDDSPRQMRRVQDFVMVTKGFQRDDSGNTMREAVMFRASTRAGSLSVATPQREAVRSLAQLLAKAWCGAAVPTPPLELSLVFSSHCWSLRLLAHDANEVNEQLGGLCCAVAAECWNVPFKQARVFW